MCASADALGPLWRAGGRIRDAEEEVSRLTAANAQLTASLRAKSERLASLEAEAASLRWVHNPQR